MNPESELHALLVKLREVEQRAELHRERAEMLEWEVVELRKRLAESVRQQMREP